MGWMGEDIHIQQQTGGTWAGFLPQKEVFAGKRKMFPGEKRMQDEQVLIIGIFWQSTALGSST